MSVTTPRHGASIAVVEHADPLTGFSSRSQLLSDLHEAVAPGSPERMLAMIDIGGLGTYADDYGRLEGESLLARIGGHLSNTLGQDATYYRPRHDEMAIFLASFVSDPSSLLAETIALVNTRLIQFRITLTYGVVTVPMEAPDPISALKLADARLFLRAPARRVRERRATPR